MVLGQVDDAKKLDRGEREKGGVVMARRGAGNNIGLLGGKEGGRGGGDRRGMEVGGGESCGWALSSLSLPCQKRPVHNSLSGLTLESLVFMALDRGRSE